MAGTKKKGGKRKHRAVAVSTDPNNQTNEQFSSQSTKSNKRPKGGKAYLIADDEDSPTLSLTHSSSALEQSITQTIERKFPFIPLSPIKLSKFDCGSKLRQSINQSNNELTVIGDKGYRTVRSTHGIAQGCIYYEITINPPIHQSVQPTINQSKPPNSINPPNDQTMKPTVRVGFATLQADVDGPVGCDRFGYGWSQAGKRGHDGLWETWPMSDESINQAKNQSSTKQTSHQTNNQSYRQTANQSINQSNNQTKNNSNNQPDNQSINQTNNQSNNQPNNQPDNQSNTQTTSNRPTKTTAQVGDVVGCWIYISDVKPNQSNTQSNAQKSRIWRNDPVEAPKLDIPKSSNQSTASISQTLTQSTAHSIFMIGSQIRLYINGQFIGQSFDNLFRGLYFPCVSLYWGASVTVNFGPDFACPPAELTQGYWPPEPNNEQRILALAQMGFLNHLPDSGQMLIPNKKHTEIMQKELEQAQLEQKEQRERKQKRNKEAPTID